MTDLRADSMTGEQFVFDERTADPASTEEGERWLRTDLTSGDKIATLRVDVGSSILDVPVFPVGTAEDSVVEAIRVRVGSQTGYIPAVPETNANFPALRLQHNGQVFGYHDEQGVFAFFDVSISATNSPVEEGSDLNVDYSVVNTGFSVNNTQDIRLNIDSTEEDRDTNITLSPSSSTTATLTWTTPSSSAGTYNASVLSDDDTASTSVTVEAGPAIPDSGVARWTLDDADTSGTTTFDVFGDNDGTINGATTGATGANQQYTTNEAYSFDGSDDFVSVPHSGGLNLDGDFTINLWVNLEDTSSDRVFWIDKRPSGAGDVDSHYYISGPSFDGGTSVRFHVGNDDWKNVPIDTVDIAFSWAMVTFVFKAGDQFEAYLDGTLQGTKSTTAFPNTNNGDLELGRQDNNGGRFYFDGRQDDVRIYDKALSSTEVSNLYNTGSING